MNGPSNDIIARFTDDLVSAVLNELGTDRVLSVFVGGSVAGNEASFCSTAEGVEVYSDVDLYFVVRDGVESEEARVRAREAAAGVPLAGDGYCFLRAPDIGVYSHDGLAAQPPRPGTVGLDTKHRMLFGDPDVPARAAERIGTRIPVEEALFLLENRLSELAAFQREVESHSGSQTGREERYYAFVACKTSLDVGTAALIERGEYAPKRSERLDRLQALCAVPGSEWTEERFALVRRCGDALSLMPSPDWARLVPAGVTANEAVELALAEWKRIAAGNLPGIPARWSRLVLERCRVGDYVNNFRQFRALNARCGFKRRGSLTAGVHLSRYSPVDALRLSAMMEYLRSDDAYAPENGELVDTLGPFLDRLTRSCGFEKGSLTERTFEMYRAVQ